LALFAVAVFACDFPKFSERNLKRQSAPAFEYNRLSANGPFSWGNLTGYSTCGTGQNQSPLNIVTGTTVGSNLPPLVFTSSPITTAFHNNGHTFQIDGVGNTVTISGGPLPTGDTYALQQFHFHSPCEHHFDGFGAAAEIHFVFQTLNTAHQGTNDPLRLCVVGMLYEEAPQVSSDDPFLAQFITNFPTLAAGGNGQSMNISINFSVFNGKNINNYYTYYGSLTTPACNEVVTWILLNGPSPISPVQAQYFETSLALPINNRPIQALNSRVISNSFGATAAPTAAAANPNGAININFAGLFQGFN